MSTTKTQAPTSELTRETREKHAKHMLPATIQYYQEPVVLTEGKGLRIKDADGNEYLDFFGGILTVSVGHANEKVNAAIVAQISRLSHVSTLYPVLPVVELAERLARLSPGNLSQCFLATSGTEADETAVMLAQLSTGATEIVALRHGYSGRSMLAQSLTAHSTWRPLPSQVAGVKHAVSPYCYRCPLKLTYPSCGVACASDIEDLIRTTTTGRIAGFIAEPIQGVGGFITPPPEYFEIAVGIIKKYGGVFICDEVQTGFGRTGGKMWGIEQYGVAAGHHDDGQGHRQRTAARRDDRDARDRGVVEIADDLDLRRQPGLVRGCQRHARRSSRKRTCRETPRAWARSCAPASRSCRDAIRGRSGRCAVWGSCRRSSSSRTRPRGTGPRRRR